MVVADHASAASKLPASFQKSVVYGVATKIPWKQGDVGKAKLHLQLLHLQMLFEAHCMNMTC